ncbi:hypothetical protein CP960_12760 [Malaciobacter halophilus]|uniref:Lipoprotein n=1 Tax=Malaciobacter halophilus TaxID=197482 RepID=A0A2N1IZR1_9BACT|nr:hypothetical protein [Malaciobacter halophilus]AXH08675.1 hypothetical protein AHALO_0274 [Malaciobacter halophilus]PKI79782.1 hypothetical protein CP960_12760 [Malaciobacter halophilus]
MKKLLFISSILILFVACTPFSVNSMKLPTKTLDLKGAQTTATFHPCANFSYTSKINDKNYGKLFIEYINLDSNCSWNGFERGFFEELFKQTLKIKSMKIVEQYDFDNYEFTTYLIDNSSYVNLIYVYAVNRTKFILDYNAKLSLELIKEYKPSYESKYLHKNRFKKDYSMSLVRMANFYSYFSKESNRFLD